MWLWLSASLFYLEHRGHSAAVPWPSSGELVCIQICGKTLLFCTGCFTSLFHSDLFALEAMCRILVYIANINNCQVVGTHHQMEVQTDYWIQNLNMDTILTCRLVLGPYHIWMQNVQTNLIVLYIGVLTTSAYHLHSMWVHEHMKVWGARVQEHKINNCETFLPISSSIMVRFSIHFNCWNCLDLIYVFLCN